MKKRFFQRAANIALSAILVCGLLPATSFADDASVVGSGADEATGVVGSAVTADAESTGAGADAGSQVVDTDAGASAQDPDDSLVLPEGALLGDEDAADAANVAGAAGAQSAADEAGDVDGIALYASDNDGTQPDSGYCGASTSTSDGTNISYYYDGAGTLTLTGTGATEFYNEYDRWGSFYSPVPGWYSYRDKITTINVGEGITVLDSAIFAHTSITSITLPSSVKKIGQIAFLSCTKLSSITLNEGLESIGGDAFRYTRLPKLYIPSTVSSINASVFRTIDVYNVTIDPANPYLVINNNILYSKDMTQLLRVSFAVKGALVVPSTVTSIGEMACEDMGSITSVTFPAGLKSIGEAAFNLSGLTSVEIPDSVTSIGRSAFSNCTSMVSAKMGSGFKGSTASDANNIFAYNRNLSSVELAEGLEVIENGMFEDCEKLTSVNIPSTVKSIERYAFNCAGLTSVDIPDGVTSIGRNAFANTNITEVDIPDSVESIDVDAFPEGAKVTGSLIQMADGSYVSPSSVATIEYDVTYKEEDARSMLAMINEFRRSSDAWYWDSDNTTKVTVSGLADLRYDANLEAIAQARAAEIAINFDHTRPDGSSCFAIESNGISSSGENIAAGYSTAEYAFTGWREDNENYWGQGHRRNMLGSWTAVGIGHVVYNGIDYWVQEFASLSSSSITAPSPAYEAIDGTYSMSVPYDRFTQFPDVDSFTFPDSLGLEHAGQTAEVPSATAKMRFEDTWPRRAFTARLIPYWKSTDSSQLEVTDDGVRALVDGPSCFITAKIKDSQYRVAAGSYSLAYTVGQQPFAADKYLVRYTSKVASGKVPTLFGQALSAAPWGGYATLVDASTAAKVDDASFSLVAGTASVETQLCDVSGNGMVNIVDAQIAYDLSCGHYANFSLLPLTGWLAADANADGAVDAADAFTIQRAAVRAALS